MSEERWQDSLESEELQTSPVLDRYKTPAEAYQGLIEKESMLGRSFTLLGKDASAEQRTKWLNESVAKHMPEMMLKPTFDTEDGAKETWAMLGVPEDKSGYELPEDFKGLPDGMEDQLIEIALNMGATKEQYQAMVTHYADASVTLEEGNVLAQEESEAELKGLWGNAYDQNVGITDSLAEKFAGKDLPLGPLNNAARVWMMNVSKSLTNDPQVFNQINNPDAVPSPGEAKAKMAEMRGADIYLNKAGKFSKDERTAFLNRYNKLLALAAKPGTV